MSQNDFHKIRRLPPYVFEEVNKLKARLRNQGVDIIDFGMGNPDLPVPKHIVDKLCETAAKPRTNRYSASRGIPGLRRAMAGYYERRFGVKLNPDTQIVREPMQGKHAVPVAIPDAPPWWIATSGDETALAFWRGGIAAVRWMAPIANR